MSDTNRIFDDKYRENFLRNSDPLALNDYLKNMERLSRKGGKYLEMYNKDMIFLLELNDTVFQDGGNIGSIFSRSQTKSNTQEQTPIVTEQPCDTEVYIGRINNITNKIVQSTNTDLEIIKKALIDNSDYNNKKKAIIKFIDTIMHQDSVFIKEYDDIRIKYIKELSNLIAKNNDYMKEAFVYLTKILQTNKNIISEEFMKDYINLRNKKILPEYELLKEKLINDYNKKLGIEKVYASKFVEKVINEYKKSKN